MQQHFETILGELQGAHAASNDCTDYIDFLDRVMQEVRSVRMAARFEKFGQQFTPAEPAMPALVEGPPQSFVPGQQVQTDNGYVGYVSRYDSKGNVVVNVVFQACEFQEAQLKPSKLG